MYIPFEDLPGNSKIWIYQANRKLSDSEVDEITEATKEFVENWAAHGTSLEASFITKYNRFIILAINQDAHPATGCSIDSSVQFIQNLEAKYGIDLLDKMNVTYKTGEFIAFKTLLEFKQLAKSKSVSENTIVFNNLVNTIEEWQDFWEVPANESWHSRFF